MNTRPDVRGSEMPEPQRAARGDGRGELREQANEPRSQVADGRTAGVWQDIKSRFVDDPAGALAAAEECVHRAVEEKVRAAEEKVRALKAEAEALCARERDEDGSSTENLRMRLIRYQEYCERLASNAGHQPGLAARQDVIERQ